jgi:hypothetical protein
MRATIRSAQRGLGRVFDALGASPFGIVVFAMSVALLVYLQFGVLGGVWADAVEMGNSVALLNPE